MTSIPCPKPWEGRKPTRRPDDLKLGRAHRRILQLLKRSGGPVFPFGAKEEKALEQLLDHGILEQTGEFTYRVKG